MRGVSPQLVGAMQLSGFRAVCGVALLLLSGCAERPTAPHGWQVAAESVGPIHFGMHPAQAAEAIGGPAAPVFPDSSCDYWHPEGSPAGVRFMVEIGQVVRVDVDSPGVPTISGLQVGSPISAVRAALGTAVIDEPHKYNWDVGWRTLSAFTPDSAFGLVFEVDSHVVRTFRAGLWPPVGYIEHCS